MFGISIRNFGTDVVVVFLFNTFLIRSFREEYRAKEEKNRSKEQSTHTPQSSLIFLNIIVII
jgi:hypothetical protein